MLFRSAATSTSADADLLGGLDDNAASPDNDDNNNNNNNDDNNNTNNNNEAVADKPFEPSTYVPESDALLKWQEEHNKYLDEKSSKENQEQQELREKAGQTWDQMYAERQALKDTNAKANREAEDDFIKARDQALTSGETWERVAFFCDFQLSGEGRDTSRMRE